MRKNKAWTGCAAGTAPSGPATCSAPPTPQWPSGGSRNAPKPWKTSPSASTKPGTAMTEPHHSRNRPPASAHPKPDQHPVSKAPATEEAEPLSPALDKTFKIGLVLKGLDGVLEVIGGILLLFLSPQAIQHVVRALTAHELSEDPHDMIARYLLHTTAHLHHGTTLFGAIYLLSHGIAKVVLVALVLRDKLWAYPWLIGLLLAFIAYQLYQITAVHFSAGLTALTVFDAFLVWLTWREYRSKRAQQQARAAVAAPSPGGHRAARPQSERRT